MQDCINCLQQCTLIDLQQSPQLLRRSLLPSHARNFVLWASLKVRQTAATGPVALLTRLVFALCCM